VSVGEPPTDRRAVDYPPCSAVLPVPQRRTAAADKTRSGGVARRSAPEANDRHTGCALPSSVGSLSPLELGRSLAPTPRTFTIGPSIAESSNMSTFATGRVRQFAFALLLGGCGASSPSTSNGVPVGSWGQQTSAAICARLFSCCNASEAAQMGYTTEAQCVTTLGGKEQTSLDQVLSAGIVRYDGQAAVTCLSDISAGSCAALFRLGNLTLPASCSDVAPGTGQTGAPCEDLDFVCASDDCESSYCAAPSCRTISCPTGQYCDPTSLGCLPGQPAGSSCMYNAECDPSIVCRAGSCGAPLPDQSACEQDTDCVRGACIPLASDQTTGATCGAPQPDGSPCVSAAECLSAGCNETSPGVDICGAPICAGT
jgi:hypothetical protein